MYILVTNIFTRKVQILNVSLQLLRYLLIYVYLKYRLIYFMSIKSWGTDIISTLTCLAYGVGFVLRVTDVSNVKGGINNVSDDV